jgi:hypothetical protein
MIPPSVLTLLCSLLRIAAGNHDHEHAQDFSAKRLNDLSAKWGIDV